MAKLLEIQDLQTLFYTSAGTVKAVDEISYDVEEGETVAIVGESGCGKSVSALSILRLIANPPGEITGGKINFMGQVLALENNLALGNFFQLKNTASGGGLAAAGFSHQPQGFTSFDAEVDAIHRFDQRTSE